MKNKKQKHGKELFTAGNMYLCNKGVKVYEVLKEDGTIDKENYRLIAVNFYNDKPLYQDFDEHWPGRDKLLAITTVSKKYYENNIEQDCYNNTRECQRALLECGIDTFEED